MTWALKSVGPWVYWLTVGLNVADYFLGEVVSSSYFGILIVVFSVLLCNIITYLGEVVI